MDKELLEYLSRIPDFMRDDEIKLEFVSTAASIDDETEILASVSGLAAIRETGLIDGLYICDDNIAIQVKISDGETLVTIACFTMQGNLLIKEIQNRLYKYIY